MRIDKSERFVPHPGTPGLSDYLAQGGFISNDIGKLRHVDHRARIGAARSSGTRHSRDNCQFLSGLKEHAEDGVEQPGHRIAAEMAKGLIDLLESVQIRP